MGRGTWPCPQLRMTAITTATSGKTGPKLRSEAIRPAASSRPRAVGRQEAGRSAAIAGPTPAGAVWSIVVAYPWETGSARSRLCVSCSGSSLLEGHGLPPGGTTRSGGSDQLPLTAAWAPRAIAERRTEAPAADGGPRPRRSLGRAPIYIERVIPVPRWFGSVREEPPAGPGPEEEEEWVPGPGFGRVCHRAMGPWPRMSR